MSQTYIKTTQEFGRGLYAANELQAGKILFTAELLVLSPADTIKVNETDLKYYTFKFNETQDCLVLGDGEIFNHADSANIGYKLIDYGNQGRQIMVFFTLQKIEQDSQLFIDYNADVQVDTTAYVTKNLVG